MGDTRKIKYYKPKVPKNKKSKAKKIILIVLSVIGALLLIVALFFAWLTINEYKPAAKESIAVVENEGAQPLTKELSILSWNIGYSGLGKYEDFVMDGGKTDGKPDTVDIFKQYFEGIISTLRENTSDIYIMQEVDKNSDRSYHYDEVTSLGIALSAASTAFAVNYNCKFVPFPWPPIGSVLGGQVTLSKSAVVDNTAERIALTNSIGWPMSAAYLKRCLLVTRYEIEGSDKQLVVINFHLEAYDGGEGSSQQVLEMWEIMKKEYEAGNYVIAGGDFNQALPGSLEKYPLRADINWKPGIFNTELLTDGWQLSFDDSTPTCRSLDMPYDANYAEMQHYVIDGFITSPNIEIVEVKTIGTGFEYTDHNPVKLQVKLK